MLQSIWTSRRIKRGTGRNESQSRLSLMYEMTESQWPVVTLKCPRLTVHLTHPLSWTAELSDTVHCEVLGFAMIVFYCGYWEPKELYVGT